MVWLLGANYWLLIGRLGQLLSACHRYVSVHILLSNIQTSHSFIIINVVTFVEM